MGYSRECRPKFRDYMQTEMPLMDGPNWLPGKGGGSPLNIALPTFA